MSVSASDIEAFVMSLPETTKGEHGHRPGFRVRKSLVVVIENEGDVALLCVEPDERNALLIEAPKAFKEIRNKNGKLVESWITVDLAKADAALVYEVIEDAWRRFAPKRAIEALDRLRSG